MGALGREAQRVGVNRLRAIAALIDSARDAERLAKIRSGKLKVEPDELQALLAEDRAALMAWKADPYG